MLDRLSPIGRRLPHISVAVSRSNYCYYTVVRDTARSYNRPQTDPARYLVAPGTR